MESNPFVINWTDLDQVIRYAKELGYGQTVFKVPGRDNYNITHTERTDRYKPEWVLFQTEERSILGNPISLVNESDHQRFWLPNRDYIYDMQKVRTPVGMAWRHHIIHNETQRVIDFVVDGKVYRYFDLPATHPHTGRFNLYAQELAAKRYPRPVRRDRAGKQEKEKVVYNVVNKDNPSKPLMEHTAFLHMAQQFKAVQVVKYPGSVFEIVEITQGS